MSTRHHRSSAEFAAWAAEHSDFEDAYLRAIEPLPATDPAPAPTAEPAEVTLELAYQVGGSSWAGERRRLRRVRLRCEGVHRLTLGEPGVLSTEHCSLGMEFADVPGRICFSFDALSRLMIECSAVVTEDLAEVEEVVEPWESDWSVFVEARGAIPTPHELLAKCQAAAGTPVVWRMYGDAPRSAADVPADAYGGWMLQTADRVGTCVGGIELAPRPSPSGFTLTMTRCDPKNARLWAAGLEALATLDVTWGQCGNRRLGPDDLRELAARSSRELVHRRG